MKTIDHLPEIVDGLPNICGAESAIEQALKRSAERAVFLDQSGVDFSRIRGASAIALHMHQPLIPAGGADLRTRGYNRQPAADDGNPGAASSHNAGIFRWCYKRMGEFIPQLVGEGKQPRVMLDYSGTLLYGLRQMGLDDVLDSLRGITCEPRYRRCVEWLGSAWGHAVAPSTPVQDYRLHVSAWQHHFAAIFGLEALAASAGSRPPKWRCPTIPTSPTSS